MNPRQRYLAALTFATPDKIPFEPGWPRESTLAAWRQQGLPAQANWFNLLLESIGVSLDHSQKPSVDLGVDFTMRPQF